MTAEAAAPVAAAQTLSTAAELQQRIADRPTPRAEPHLTPDNQDAREVEKQVNRESESRIGDLKQRLQNMRDRAEHAQAWARLPGHSRAAFNKARERDD